MSASQLRVNLVPIPGLIAFHGTIPKTLEMVRYSADQPISELEKRVDQLPDYWGRVQEQDHIVDAVARLLPEAASWSTSARMFGEKGEDWIEIWKNGADAIDSVMFAYSLRKLNGPYVRESLNIARMADCVIQDIQSGNLFEPSDEKFVAMALACSAARFLPDRNLLESLLAS